MYWIVGILLLAVLLGSYSAGWHRRNRGLPLVPFTVGKDGVHRLPVLLFALLLASALVACSTERYPQATKPPADTTVARPDSDRHDGEHHEGGQHGHEDAAKP